MLDELKAYKDWDVWTQSLIEKDVPHFLLNHELLPQKDCYSSDMFNSFGRYADIHHTTGVFLSKGNQQCDSICLPNGRYGAQQNRYSVSCKYDEFYTAANMVS